MKLFRTKKVSPTKYTFFKEGFHGDKYLLGFVNRIIKEFDVAYFIETRTNVGSTIAYVGNKYPDIKCYSCEPEDKSFFEASKNTIKLKNISLFNLDSINFLNKIEHEIKKEKPVLFWIDAHGYGFQWPLKEEIEIITKNYTNAFIFIDDFKVTNQPQFLYDKYDGQVCSYDYIKENISADREYKLVYPYYNEKTSTHHPLKGWVLITNNRDFNLEKEESLNYYQLHLENGRIKYNLSGHFNSVGITNQDLINEYINKPDFTFLISFPRTGSHWLRNIMELYFEGVIK